MSHEPHRPHQHATAARRTDAEPARRVPSGQSVAAVLALQRSAGNQSVVRLLSRAPAPAAPAASGGALLTEFFSELWQEDPSSVVRLGLEVLRPFPLWGGIPGAVADVIAAGQDVMSVPFGNPADRGISAGNVAYSSVVELTIGARSLVNIANNAVGALLTVPQFAAGLGVGATAGEVGSGVAAPAAVPTGGATAAAVAAAEVLGALKLELATATGIFDGLITLEAGAGALAFPDDGEAWLKLMTNYIGNVLGDAFGLFNDAVGEFTFGLSQSGEFGQGLETLQAVVTTALKAFGIFNNFVNGLWDVLGGQAVEGIPLPERRDDEGLTPTEPQSPPATVGFSVARAAVDGAPVDWAAHLAELDAATACQARGEAILGPLADQVGELVEAAAAKAGEVAMGQESVAQLREALMPTLANFEERLALVSGVEAQAAPALERLDSLGQQLDGAIAALEGVSLDIGEGGVADALEGALGGGFDVAKQAALEPLRELQASIGPLREAVEAMVQTSRMLTPPLTDAIARLHEALAQADSLPELMSSMADQCVAVTSGGALTSLEDLRANWQELGPALAKVTEAVHARGVSAP